MLTELDKILLSSDFDNWQKKNKEKCTRLRAMYALLQKDVNELELSLWELYYIERHTNYITKTIASINSSTPWSSAKSPLNIINKP